MEKVSEIRNRISAVEETRKITNAMQLVATARAKKVFPQMGYNQSFLQRVQSVMKDVLLSPHLAEHPYLHWHSHQKRSYIVIAADKGMAGDYNSAVLGLALKEIQEKIHQKEDLHLTAVGIVGDIFFRSRGYTPDHVLPGITRNPTLYHARTIARDIMAHYDQKETEQVFVIYTPFVNGQPAKPIIHRMLPLRMSDFGEIEGTDKPHEIMYHPSETEVFHQLIPQYFVSYLFGALMHAYASEHTSRMTAMQSATRNADEMLETLRLEYNLARQAAVTQEIAELSSSLFV